MAGWLLDCCYMRAASILESIRLVPAGLGASSGRLLVNLGQKYFSAGIGWTALCDDGSFNPAKAEVRAR